jgi:hypothetical protein
MRSKKTSWQCIVCGDETKDKSHGVRSLSPPTFTARVRDLEDE